MIKEALPEFIQNYINEERNTGVSARVMDMLFIVLKSAQPGGLQEREQLREQLENPQPCQKPESCLRGLRKWYSVMARASVLQMQLPPTEHLIRGAMSLYDSVFNEQPTASLQTKLEYMKIKEKHGYPYKFTLAFLREQNKFAEDNLADMVQKANESTSMALPLGLTPQQKAQQADKDKNSKAQAATVKEHEARANAAVAQIDQMKV